MFRKKTNAPKSDTSISQGKAEKLTPAETPYMAARREWNERYGDYIASARNWRFIALVLGVISLILAIGSIYIGAQSKRIPYIVEVDKIGQVVNVAPAEKASVNSPRIVKAMLMRFIIDWRAVSPDAVVQKAATDRLYKMVPQGGASLEKINSYYRDNSPYVVAQSYTVSIEPIGTPLPLSEQSWQVEWWETKRNLTGAQLSRTRYKGVLMVAFNPPKDENQALDLDNPIGLYVIDLNWSQQL